MFYVSYDNRALGLIIVADDNMSKAQYQLNWECEEVSDEDLEGCYANEVKVQVTEDDNMYFFPGFGAKHDEFGITPEREAEVIACAMKHPGYKRKV